MFFSENSVRLIALSYKARIAVRHTSVKRQN